VTAGFDLAAAAEQVRQYQDKLRLYELFNGPIQRSVPVSTRPCPREQPVALQLEWWECPDCDYTFGPTPIGMNIKFVAHKCTRDPSAIDVEFEVVGA
jgi:hypothetical protein